MSEVSTEIKISVDFDLCIDCGACVSLCPVDALVLNEEWNLEFDEEKCNKCSLCLDSCPRFAIIKS